MNFILFLSIMCCTILILYIMYNINKKDNKLEDKIAHFMISITILAISSIYLLDKYNIPTEFKMNLNVNTQNWLNVIMTYISSILSAVIGAVVSVYITIYQIKKNKEDNDKRDKENLRIQNMPMLKYEIKTTSNKNDYKIDLEHFIITNCNERSMSTYNLFILIKNIGLNNVRRIIVDFESSMTNNTYRIIGENTIISIEKNEEKEIFTYFTLEREKEYSIKLNVYYEDALQNWYYQVIDIKYDATKDDDNSLPIGQVRYKVNEEILVADKEVPINENINS